MKDPCLAVFIANFRQCKERVMKSIASGFGNFNWVTPIRKYWRIVPPCYTILICLIVGRRHHELIIRMKYWNNRQDFGLLK